MNKITPKITLTLIAGFFIMLIYAMDVLFFNLLFKAENEALFFIVIICSTILMSSVYWSEAGNDIFIREIPGIKAQACAKPIQIAI